MFTDINEAVQHWYSLFNDCLNNHAPLKTSVSKESINLNGFPVK